MNTIDVARQEIFARFQQDDGGKFWVERYPWVVSYSGGKDSTLLLLLVCEALERFGSLRTVWVIFSDTGIEQDGIVERVRRNFDGLEFWAAERGLDVRTAIIAPEVGERFFNMIVGRGYAAPCPPRLRWCVDRLKTKPISLWKRATFGSRGRIVMLTGERFAESPARKERMESRLGADAFYSKSKYERVYCPIRDVPTRQLWAFVWSRPFPWFESFCELLEQYNVSEVKEVLLQDRERRSGCRFCTFSCTRKGASTIEDENAFCRELAACSEKDIVRRNLIDIKLLASHYNAPKNRKRNKEVICGNYAIGRMNIDARKATLDRVRELEAATNRVWIGAEDLAFIERQWAEDEERIRRGELVDARTVLKTSL